MLVGPEKIRSIQERLSALESLNELFRRVLEVAWRAA
jgi:hypothetical protein